MKNLDQYNIIIWPRLRHRLPPPARQTHAFRTLASQPRLTRETLAVPSQLVSGRGVRRLAAGCALLTIHHCIARPYTPTKRRARAGGGVAPAHPTDMSDTVSAPYSSSRPPMVHPVLETKVKSRPRTERHNPRLPSSMCHCQTTCETHHKSAQSRKHPAPQQNTKKPPAL